MSIVELGKKGQLSLPATVLRKLGLQGATTLLVEATDDGAVILRPAAVYPIELYTDACINRDFRFGPKPSLPRVAKRTT